MFEKMSAETAEPPRVCSLVTGQQMIEPEGATHKCCTVEMLSFTTPYDVVVIDEIQKICDSNRGWAWTRALLGSPAREVNYIM